MRHIFLLGLGLVSMVALAQNATRKAPIKPVEKQFDITLGNGGDTFTYIPAKQVDSFFQLPVYLKDKNGAMLPAVAFEVMYAEWGVFEDSTGRDKVMTEYYTLSVNGATLPKFYADNISSLAKAGDTLTIYKVWAEKIDASKTQNLVLEASSKKFIIN